MEEYIIESLEFEIELDKICNRSIVETDLTNLLFLEGVASNRVFDSVKSLLERIKEMITDYIDRFKVKLEEGRRKKIADYLKNLSPSEQKNIQIIIPDVDICVKEYTRSMQKFQKLNLDFLKKEMNYDLTPIKAETLVKKMIKEIEREQKNIDKLISSDKKITVNGKEFLKIIEYQSFGIQQALMDYREMVEESIRIVETYQMKIDMYNKSNGRIGYPSNFSDYLRNLTQYVKRNSDVIAFSLYSSIVLPRVTSYAIDTIMPDDKNDSSINFKKIALKSAVIGATNTMGNKMKKDAKIRNTI